MVWFFSSLWNVIILSMIWIKPSYLLINSYWDFMNKPNIKFSILNLIHKSYLLSFSLEDVKTADNSINQIKLIQKEFHYWICKSYFKIQFQIVSFQRSRSGNINPLLHVGGQILKICVIFDPQDRKSSNSLTFNIFNILAWPHEKIEKNIGVSLGSVRIDPPP